MKLYADTSDLSGARRGIWTNEQKVETLDSAAYSAYKGKQVDLTTRDGFGEYSYDLFFEVMREYPGLAGFWIDNDNAYWERNHLYEQIRERRPSWLFSNNNEDTPIMDTVSNEQKTGMTPDYDYPQGRPTRHPIRRWPGRQAAVRVASMAISVRDLSKSYGDTPAA